MGAVKPVDVVAVGDVTGDGRDDIIAGTGWHASSSDHKVFLYAQTLQGTLAPPIVLADFANSNNVRVALGDLDKNGIADVVIGHAQGMIILLAQGNSRFVASSKAGPICANLAIADVNSDGNLDILRQSDDDNLTLFYGNGSGAFSGAPFDTTAGGHEHLKVADVTGDGLVDLILTSSLWTESSSVLTVYANNGVGSFGAPRSYFNAEADIWGMRAIAIGDFNSDGLGDVVTTSPANSPSSRLWFQAQARKTGTLVSAQPLDTYDIPEAIAAADLDHDGYEDLVVAHGGWDAFGTYMQDSTGLGSEQLVNFPSASHYDHGGLSTGDVNSDGCTDAVLAHSDLGSFGGMNILHGKNCHERWSMANRHDGDFDGDGKSDILWHDAATGASTIWKSGNSATQVPVTRVTDTAWTIAGVGDFNGDGKSDLLWHHTVTGANALWYSAVSSPSRSLQRVTDLNWEIVGIGDFDGNRKDDILWRHKYTGANAIWKEALYSKPQNLTTITDRDWIIVGVGDFDGNGKSDILWRHRADGRNAIWRNADYANNQAVSTVPDLGWQVAGIGDFDHDGRSDILWHHAFDGQNAIWHSASYVTSRFLTQITDLRWKIAGVGDYDHDGRSDILWRHSGTGANTIWRDADSATLQPVTGVTSMNWKVVR